MTLTPVIGRVTPRLTPLIHLALLLANLVSADGICPSECVCESTRVACSAPTLTTVPHFLNPRIRHLDLSGSSIALLDHGLDFYTNLRTINISNSAVRSLGENQFSRLNQLSNLQVWNNRLESLTPGAFHGLENLLKLNLRSNLIKHIQHHAFKGLDKLVLLDLSKNKLTVLEQDMFKHLPSLQTLILAKNQIRVVGSLALPSVLSINLAQNLIQRILRSSESPPLLQEVDLSDNMLSEIEAGSWSNSSSLSRLDLSYNKLNSLPSLNVPLRHFILSGNMIRTLSPADFAGYVSLEHIGLNNMPVLTTILPNTFTNNINLKSISLSNNHRLVPLPSDLFTDCKNLRVLDLSQLPWSTLNPDQVGGSLSRLRLGGTPLVCSCSLAWLKTLAHTRPGLVEGAQCDNISLEKVPDPRLHCGDGDFTLIIGIVSGSVLIIILLVVLVVAFSCCRARDTKHHCDYLQYTECHEDKLVKPVHGVQQYIHCTTTQRPYTESSFGPEYMSDGNLLLKQNSVFGGDYGLSNYERPSETLARKFGTRLRNLDTENEHVFAGSPSRLLNTTDSPLHSHKIDTEPLYYTVTTNPLEEYSSGYHGSSAYTNSSSSSDGSTLLNYPKLSTCLPNLATNVQSNPMSTCVPYHGTNVHCNPMGTYAHQNTCSNVSYKPQTLHEVSLQAGNSHVLPVHFEHMSPKVQRSPRKLVESKKNMFQNATQKKKERFPDILPFTDKGQNYFV